MQQNRKSKAITGSLNVRIPAYLIAVAFVIVTFGFFDSQLSAQTESKFSDLTKQVPATNTELFAVNEIATHIETLLANRALDRFLSESELVAVLGAGRRAPGDAGITDSALEWMDENRRYFPGTVAISASDDIYPFLGSVFEIMSRLNLAAMSVPVLFDEQEQPGEMELKEHELLQQELLKYTREFRVPDIGIWLEWDEPETAESIFQLIRQQTATALVLTKVEAFDEDNRFGFDCEMNEIFDPSIVELFATDLGMDDSARALSKTVSELSVFFEVQLMSPGIRILISTEPADEEARSADAANLFPDIQNGSGEIAFSTWNSQRLLEVADNFEDSLERWKKTSLGKQALEFDYDDTWGSFRQAVAQVRMIGDTGRFRLWHEKGQVRATVTREGVEPAKSLAGNPMLQFVPEDSETFALSSTRSFGSFTQGWMSYYEEQMATRQLRSDISGNEAQGEFLQMMIEGYYGNFGSVRDLVNNDIPPLTKAPTGVIIDSRGRINSLRIESDDLAQAIQRRHSGNAVHSRIPERVAFMFGEFLMIRS